jgi:hypothetical protein
MHGLALKMLFFLEASFQIAEVGALSPCSLRNCGVVMPAHWKIIAAIFSELLKQKFRRRFNYIIAGVNTAVILFQPIIKV